jgi:Ran GTPase-activating protein (RanGAP) involved in mRNA processing and transport
MSNNFAKTQLFFKRLLLEKISNPDLYKDFKKKFSLNLDYDLSDEDLEYLTQLIDNTDNMYNINIRLSETIMNEIILNKLLEKMSQKKKITYLSFYIKYLNDKLFSEFANFILNINSSLTSFKLQIKYKNENIEEKRIQIILTNLINNNNLNINNLYFINCRFSTNESINLLNDLFVKNKNKIKNISLYNSVIFNNNFNADISSIKNVEISYYNLSKIQYLPIQKLNLSNNNISLDGIKIISDLLENSNCTLEKLNLNYNYLGDEGCTILSYGIKKNKTLITLNLSHNNIIYKGLIDIAFSLNSKNEDGIYNNTIKKLNFSRNCISNAAFVDFCEILKNEPEERFTKLNFQYNNITDLSINQFGEFIQKYPNQTFLSLTNRISEKNKVNFFNFCKKLTNIKKIMIQNFRFNEDNSKIFNEFLLNNKNIENIFIYYNSLITPEDIITITPGIEHNKNLIQIYLTQCYIEDEGAIALSNALFNNINISQIHLDENKIGEKGAKAISEKLLGKVSLKKLILSHNLINSQGAFYIGENLKEAQGIQYLLINSNMIEDEGCEFLSKGIEKNNSLVQLNINNNNITKKGIKFIAKSLLGKESFMTLSAADNKITEVEEELYKLLNWCKNIVISSNPLSKEGIIRLFQGTENNKLFKSLRFKILDDNINYNFKCFNKNLKEFDLSYNNKMNISLIKHVLSLENISQLDIQSNRIGDENISTIVNYIKKNNIRLKSLKLQSNLIGPKGSISISELFKNNNYLTIINLAGNPLGYKGIKHICNAIELFPNVLEELLLNFTQCNNYCSKDIYNMLIKNNRLKVISLIGNFFNNEGIDTILSSLRINNSLKELSIGENRNINSKGFQNLASYLRFNKSLNTIEIKSSRLNDNILKELCQSLKDNKKIISLNLIDNNLGYQNTIKFGLYIKKNDVINEIKMLLNKPSKDEQALIKACNPHILFN